LWLPIFLALQAEGHFKAGRNQAALHSIEQALATSEETGERWAIAEILRVKANLLQTTGHGKAEEVEGALFESLEIARQQQAKSWELRAATSLAQLWRDQGKVQQARELLAPSYGWFTEGFDTRDLKEARALLDTLAA
jgi:predicted ATPase